MFIIERKERERANATKMLTIGESRKRSRSVTVLCLFNSVSLKLSKISREWGRKSRSLYVRDRDSCGNPLPCHPLPPWVKEHTYPAVPMDGYWYVCWHSLDHIVIFWAVQSVSVQGQWEGNSSGSKNVCYSSGRMTSPPQRRHRRQGSSVRGHRSPVVCPYSSAALTRDMEERKEGKNILSPSVIGGRGITQSICYNHQPWRPI